MCRWACCLGCHTSQLAAWSRQLWHHSGEQNLSRQKHKDYSAAVPLFSSILIWESCSHGWWELLSLCQLILQMGALWIDTVHTLQSAGDSCWSKERLSAMADNRASVYKNMVNSLASLIYHRSIDSMQTSSACIILWKLVSLWSLLQRLSLAFSKLTNRLYWLLSWQHCQWIFWMRKYKQICTSSCTAFGYTCRSSKGRSHPFCSPGSCTSQASATQSCPTIQSFTRFCSTPRQAGLTSTQLPHPTLRRAAFRRHLWSTRSSGCTAQYLPLKSDPIQGDTICCRKYFLCSTLKVWKRPCYWFFPSESRMMLSKKCWDFASLTCISILKFRQWANS